MESSGITSNRIESYHATLKAIRVKWVLLIEDDKDEDDDEDDDEDVDVFFSANSGRHDPTCNAQAGPSLPRNNGCDKPRNNGCDKPRHNS